MSNPVIKHQKNLTIPDGTDPDVVRPSDWNADHEIEQNPNRMLGRIESGAGPTQELTPEQSRTVMGLGTAALVDVGTSEGNVPVLGSDGKFDEGVLPDIASDASEIDYDDSVTDFGLDPADLNVQKAIEAVAQLVVGINETKSDVRQTVNTGPVDSDGQADFLEPDTGLQVVTKDVSESTPLNITFGDGFDADGKRDVVVVINSSLSFTPPDNTDGASLYIKVSRSTGAVSTEASALVPIYDLAEPSSPAVGQKWYPKDHRHPMREWDGSEWNDGDLIICVGQCSTDGGSVVDLRSYQYQGKFHSNEVTISNMNQFSHNIGVAHNLLDTKWFVVFQSSESDYDAGDVVEFGFSAGETAGRASPISVNESKETTIRLSYQTANDLRMTRPQGGSGAVYNLTNHNLVCVSRRAF